MFNQDNRTMTGLILIVLGVLFITGQFGEIVGTYWPMIFVFLGLNQISKPGQQQWGWTFLTIGVLFQLSNLFDFSIWASFWPVVLIIIGFSILTRRPVITTKPSHPSGGYNASSPNVEHADTINESIIFWGLEKKVKSEKFQGGDITCVFGGVELDLREVHMADGARLNLTCVCGGIEISVPRNCRVEISGTAVLGGWENQTSDSSTETQQVLRIDGTVALGGVEIKY
jgi:predicted membrane protein